MTRRFFSGSAAGILAYALGMTMPGPAHGQLADCQRLQVSPLDVPGGCIERSLAEQIGTGHGDVNTPGSAVYLIKRDPARSIRRGRQLFQRKFSADQGLGPRVNFNSDGDVTMTRALAAGFADSCAACHGRPRGAAGHGGDVTTFPDSRDAPHLFGLGLVEMLADEITHDLRAIRDDAIAAAQNGEPSNRFDRRSRRFGSGGFGFRGFDFGRSRNGGMASSATVTRRLTSKGIDFGWISASPDGSVDTSRVEGVDEDLRIKPFFHDGRTISMREFIMGAFNDEMGLQAWDPILCSVTDPVTPQAMTTPAGFEYDPTEDTFSRPPVCDSGTDGDGDGVVNEVDPALVDHLEFYLLNYFKPGQYRVSTRAQEGLTLMQQIGCTSCHVKDLEINTDRRVADVETAYDPQRGILNEMFADVYPLFGVVEDGNPQPLVLPMEQSFLVENIFTDLKRHNLGPEFEERDFDGSRITMHITEPLWGVGNSAPYGHDGRSVNLDAVIRRHGGEAASVTRAYEALGERGQDKIVDFLETLVLFPPDDTASNLNPGNPGGDVQLPADHGNINLGVLFQTSVGVGE